MQYLKDKLKRLSETPYIVMSNFADFHNNLGSFKDMFYRTWFIFFLVSFPLAFLCGYVDFEVLFGLNYDSTQNYTSSFCKALIEAVLIQLSILVAGGLAIKILINGKIRIWGIQFMIFFVLASMGFARTIYLSYQTYYSAKANAQSNSEQIALEHEKQSTNLSQNQATEITKIETWYQTELDRINTAHQEQLAAAVSIWENHKKNKKAKYQRKEITKSYLNKKLSAYNTQIAKLEREYKTAQFEAQNALAIEKDKRLKPTKANYKEAYNDLKESQRIETMTLNSSIKENAQNTQGRNIGLNIISLLLQIGIMFYARGVNKETKETIETVLPPNQGNNNTIVETEDNQTIIEKPVSKVNKETETIEDLKEETVQKELYYNKQQSETAVATIAKEAVVKEPQSFVSKHKIPVYFIDGMYCIKYINNKAEEVFLGLDAVRKRMNTYRKRVDQYRAEKKIERVASNLDTLSFWTDSYTALTEFLN